MPRLALAIAACSLVALSACTRDVTTASSQPAAAVDTTDVDAAAQAYLAATPSATSWAT